MQSATHELERTRTISDEQYECMSANDMTLSDLLNPEKALIFRITHKDNLQWILVNGIHCRNSDRVDPNFVNIGNPDLISDRHHRLVSVSPGGTLSDYIPFYFTPFSIMLFNIHTGYRGLRHRRNDEIVFLITSLHQLHRAEVRFLFTDRHARLETVNFFSDLHDLGRLDWNIFQRRDFKKDPENPVKTDMY
jgi:hypothetical protein